LISDSVSGDLFFVAGENDYDPMSFIASRGHRVVAVAIRDQVRLLAS
jgi:hypothetical protein